MATTQMGVGNDGVSNSNLGRQRDSSVQVSLLVFAVEQLYALDIELVERVLRTVEIRPVPSGPEIVAGLINVRGSIIPVVDMRARLGLPKRKPRLEDCLLLVKTPRRRLALQVESVHGIIGRTAEEINSVEDMAPQTKYFAGVAKLDGEILLIQDLERLLSVEEEIAIDQTMQQNAEIAG
jgi:purine-binding chemotaxis protein CheW